MAYIDFDIDEINILASLLNLRITGCARFKDRDSMPYNDGQERIELTLEDGRTIRITADGPQGGWMKISQEHN